MSVADGRDRRGCDGPFVESFPSSSPSHATAAARRRVFRYSKRLGRRTARKQFSDCIRHAGTQIAILFNTAHFLALAPSRPLVGIQNAFVYGFVECGFFDQDALAFIMAPSLAEADDHRRKLTVLRGASCESSITTGQIDEVIEISACEAQRPFFCHEEKIALPQCLTALDTLRVAEKKTRSLDAGCWSSASLYALSRPST